MRSIVLLMMACVAVSAGCAGTETTVRARSAPGFGSGEHTYAVAEAAPDEAGRERDGRYGSEVARRLTALGYTAAPSDVARYRLALSHDTHPASVAVIDAHCTGDEACGAPTPRHASGFVWPGAKTYVHTLTLRWFDRVDGREAYAVSVAQRDREPHADHAISNLVAAALARLPFDTVELTLLVGP